MWLFNRKNRCQTLIDELYTGINGAAIAVKDRKALALTDHNFIYGEVTLLGFSEILKYVKPLAHEIFYDLGSGAGKAVFMAALLYNWQKVIGIEYLPNLYQLSTELLEKLKAQVSGNKKYSKRTANVLFLYQDFLLHDISDGDVFLLNATCFASPLWEKLIEKLLACKVGTRIITSSRRITHANFKLIEEGMYLMSWGYNSVFIYQKIC